MYKKKSNKKEGKIMFIEKSFFVGANDISFDLYIKDIAVQFQNWRLYLLK